MVRDYERICGEGERSMNLSEEKAEAEWNDYVCDKLAQSSYERGRLSERRRIIRIINQANLEGVFFRHHNYSELIEKIKRGKNVCKKRG